MKSLPFLLLLSVLIFSVFNTPIFAQGPPTTLYETSNQDGFFCEFSPSESGDSPDVVDIAHNGKRYALSLAVETENEYKLVSSLKPNVPINYDIRVTSYWDESGGEQVTAIFLTKVKVTGDPTPNSCPK
jgi:hypothetical protein